MDRLNLSVEKKEEASMSDKVKDSLKERIAKASFMYGKRLGTNLKIKRDLATSFIDPAEINLEEYKYRPLTKKKLTRKNSNDSLDSHATGASKISMSSIGTYNSRTTKVERQGMIPEGPIDIVEEEGSEDMDS